MVVLGVDDDEAGADNEDSGATAGDAGLENEFWSRGVSFSTSISIHSRLNCSICVQNSMRNRKKTKWILADF